MEESRQRAYAQSNENATAVAPQSMLVERLVHKCVYNAGRGCSVLANAGAQQESVDFCMLVGDSE
jgi:hypothetical protein